MSSINTLAAFCILVAFASATKTLEWCAYPYEPYDSDVKRNGFVLVEVNDRNRGVNWWSPVAYFDHKKGSYKGLEALLYLNDKYEVEKIKLQGYLKRDDDSSEKVLELVYTDLTFSDPISSPDKCFCSSPGNKYGVSRFERRGDCDQDVWDYSNPWQPNPSLSSSPFNPPDAVYNCPKCERELCRKNDNPYEKWTYFNSTKGVLKNLKGKNCEVYTGTAPLAQLGVEGANAKNNKLGLSVWLRCDSSSYEKQYDINLVIGPCCPYCDPYLTVPKTHEELYQAYGLDGEPNVLLEKIASMLRGDWKKIS